MLMLEFLIGGFNPLKINITSLQLPTYTAQKQAEEFLAMFQQFHHYLRRSASLK